MRPLFLSFSLARGLRAGLVLVLVLWLLPHLLGAQPRWEAVDGFAADGTPVGAGAIAFNDRNPRTIWFGATEDRLFVSHDRGRTARLFTQITLGPQSEGRPTGTIVTLFVHPADTLFMLAGSTEGVYLTRNGGTTWQHALPSTRVRLKGHSIVTDPNVPDFLYVGLFENLQAPAINLYTSFDRGRTWTAKSVQWGGAASLSAFYAGAGGPLIGGARALGGLLRQDASDVPFTRVYGVDGRTDAWDIPTIAVDPRNPAVLWAAIHGEQAPGMLLRSANTGASWQPLGSLLANPWSMALDAQGRAFVGERGAGKPGVYVSVDEGRSWQHVDVSGLDAGAEARTRMVRTGPAGVFLADDRYGLFRMENVPAVPARPSRVYEVESALPLLVGGRVKARQRQNPSGATADLLVTGLQDNGRPFAGVYTFVRDTIQTTTSGTPPDLVVDTTAYLASYNGAALPFGHWNGDALFDDFNGDGRGDVLLSGNTAPESLTVAPQTLLFLDAANTAVRTSTPFPNLYASGLTTRGDLVAIAGRGAGGLVLEIHRVTRTVVPTFSRLATLPGLEYSALALGDCDGDGDLDLFAAGAEATGGLGATIYRNTGGTFAAGVRLPGAFRGAAAFGDLDGDGTDDLAYSGYRYGPGGAEGTVHVYRMAGCQPTPVPVPETLRSMMAETMELADFDLDGDLDLIVAGLDAPFRERTGAVRVVRNDGQGGLSLNLERPGYGFGSGTFTRMGRAGVPRPSIVGLGLSADGFPQWWFYTRTPVGAQN